MNTDKACEVLGAEVEGGSGIDLEFDLACQFAISRMRELDSLEKRLRGIVAEFKEQT